MLNTGQSGPTPEPSRPEVGCSVVRTPFKSGYVDLDPASIDRSLTIDPKWANIWISHRVDPFPVRGLMMAAAIHPTVKGTFLNCIASHPAFDEVPAEAVQRLREARGRYTYIDQKEIAHHPHIGFHVNTVAVVAFALACIARVEGEDPFKKIIPLALLHDANKLAELLFQRSGELGLDLAKFDCRPGKEVLDILVKSGFREHEAQKIMNASQWVAHSSIIRFLQIDNRGTVSVKPGMISEKIVHLADDMVSETSVLTPLERMVASNFKNKYQYLWETGIGAIDLGNKWRLVECPVPPPAGVHLVGSYADLQPQLSNAICAELMEMAGESAPEPERLVVARLREKVTEWQSTPLKFGEMGLGPVE